MTSSHQDVVDNDRVSPADPFDMGAGHVDPGNKVTDILGGQSTPHCFVIDQEGVLRYSGALDDDPKGEKGEARTPYVRNAINAILAGEPVPVTTTKPYG